MSIYHQRLRKIRNCMEKRGVELLILTPSPYMFYATGIREQPYFGTLKGPGDWLNGVFIGIDRGPIFVCHWMVHRMLLRLPDGIGDAIAETRVVEHGADPLALLRSLLREFPLRQKRVAIPERAWAQFTEALRSLLPDVKISMASDLMDPLVAIKDDEALARMRRIAAITDAMYAEVLRFLRPGVTEDEVALEVDYQFRKLGAEGNAFRSSVVFARPDDVPPSPGKRLQQGDSVMFDVGGMYGGYCSDFGRSAFVGTPPRDYLELHEVVLSAQVEGMKAMKAGETTCEEIVSVVHKVLADDGYGDNLIPQAGHAIGITVHEAPLLLKGDRTVIQPGMTFTIEPTIRVPGRFSNRVEDVVLVTPNGAEYLTNYSRELTIVE